MTKSALGSRAQELHEWEMAKMAALLRLQTSVGREHRQAHSHTWPRLPLSPAQVGPGRAGAEPSLRGPRLGKGGFSLLLAILGAWATALRNWIGNLGFSAVWG